MAARPAEGSRAVPALLVLLALPGAPAHASSAPGAAPRGLASVLHRDPFERPDLRPPPPPPAAIPAPAPPPAWTHRLRATMRGAAGALANIDGVVVGVGERVDGYRVVRIDEGEVELVRGEDRRVLRIDD